MFKTIKNRSNWLNQAHLDRIESYALLLSGRRNNTFNKNRKNLFHTSSLIGIKCDSKSDHKSLTKQKRLLKFQLRRQKKMTEKINQLHLQKTLVFKQAIPIAIPTSMLAPIQSNDLCQQILTKCPKINNNVVIDGANFFSNLTKAIVNTGDELGLMVEGQDDRTSESHQFDSIHEMDHAYKYALLFFEKYVPPGSHIHFVYKKIPDSKLWIQFKEKFDEFFLNGFSNYYFGLYIVKPSAPLDKECDDRLAVRLACFLKSKGNNVVVLTNDYFRSLKIHGGMNSVCDLVTKNGFNKNLVFSAHTRDKNVKYLDYVRFNFVSEDKFFPNHRINMAMQCYGSLDARNKD